MLPGKGPWPLEFTPILRPGSPEWLPAVYQISSYIVMVSSSTYYVVPVPKWCLIFFLASWGWISTVTYFLGVYPLNFTCVNTLKAMYERSHVNIKVEPHSTFTFTCDTHTLPLFYYHAHEITPRWKSTLRDSPYFCGSLLISPLPIPQNVQIFPENTPTRKMCNQALDTDIQELKYFETTNNIPRWSDN